jgi:hypothetical protein
MLLGMLDMTRDWGKRRYLWECIKFAWRGSISLANAWAPVLGAAAIWLALWLLGFEMIVPDRLPGLIVVVCSCIGAAWLILFFARLILVAPWVLHRDAQRKTIEADERLAIYELDKAQLEILKLRWDRYGIGKIVLDFSIKNYSKPTTLKNWELNVVGPNLNVHELSPERPIFNNKTQNYDGNFIGENLTEDPLPPFAERRGQFIYACQGQQAEQFSQSGLCFELTVEDIFGRKIVAKHYT